MHDPMTVAFEIKWPFGGWKDKSGHVYRPNLITIWHVDPETDGSDDSCGWFKRAKHGDKGILKKIEQDFTFQWDHGVPKGWFDEEGNPNYSTHAIVLAMFRLAANNIFGHWSKKADKFLNQNLFNILHFAENSCDSLYTGINQIYGKEKKEQRIKEMASCVYGWVIRADLPWYRYTRWHVHHWKIQIHPLQKLRRWLLSRCSQCGKGFKWNESVCAHGWDSPLPRWFEGLRGEREIMHHACSSSLYGSSCKVPPVNGNEYAPRGFDEE